MSDFMSDEFDIRMLHRNFELGNYGYKDNSSDDPYGDFELWVSRITYHDERVKNFDRLLHQLLDMKFREYCLGSSDQIKRFLRDPQHRIDRHAIIKEILQQEPKINIDLKNDLGRLSILWLSILAGYTDSAELLVRSGADVNETIGRRPTSCIFPFQVTDDKLSILHVLLLQQMEGYPENVRLIRVLTDHGADLKARDYKGRTVLHYAVKEGHAQITQVLLEKGADANAADVNGVLPLLLAARCRKANELVQLLMKHGADVFAKDSRGRNAWYYLMNSPEEQIELARVLIEKGVPMEQNPTDFQFIHLAAYYGRNALVNLFLDNGANVNVQNRRGESPLYWAILRSRNQVVETLLKRGANIELRNYLGHTALHGVCLVVQTATSSQFLDEDSSLERTMKLLLSAGANVLARDCQNNTPFAVMSHRDNVDQPASWLLIKELALIKAIQPSIELTDEEIIEGFSKTRNYYRECFEEIERMKVTKFINTCTFFQLLAETDRQIADLMKGNPEFESEFKKYDLKGLYPIYAENLCQAFERAQKRYHMALELEKVVNEYLEDYSD